MQDLLIKLRTLREMQGYKQDFVGKHLGISQTGYSKIEKGEVDLSVKHLQKLAELYNTSTVQLLDWDGKVSIDKVIYKTQFDKHLQKVEEKIEKVLSLLEK